MKKRIYICSDSENYRNYVSEVVRSVNEDCFIHLSPNQCDLFNNLLDIENTFILCDKYFLGAKISPKVAVLKLFLCRGAKILVTAWDVKEIFFPIRLKNLGIDGFINNIGETESFVRSLKVFFEKGHFYSEDVENAFLGKTLSEYNKYISEVTDVEIETILQVFSNGSNKGVENDEKYQTVAGRTHNFKKKMGIVTDNELSELLNELKRGVLI